MDVLKPLVRTLWRQLPQGLRAKVRPHRLWGKLSRVTARTPELATKLVDVGLTLARDERRGRLSVLRRSGEPVTLFLCPEAGVASFLTAHALLARTITESGRAALMLSCGGVLPICSAKMAMQVAPSELAAANNVACDACRRAALRTGKDYGLLDISIESVLSTEDKVMIERIMAQSITEPWKTVHDGILFGEAALGETLRAQRKLGTSELDGDDLTVLRALLWTALGIYVALHNISEIYAIERIVFYGDYVYWIIAQLWARKHNVATTHLDHVYSHDVDLRFIGLRPRSYNAYQLDQIARWPERRMHPITPKIVATIGDGSLYRLRGYGGVSTYSPNWLRRDDSVQEQFSLRRDRRTILAFTSSMDEFLAARSIFRTLGRPYGEGPRPFADQTGWLEALVAWVAEQPELQLIIRTHPRIGRGRRHGTVATEYAVIREKLSGLPPNVAVVWPEDKTSSYNLAEIADVAVVAWSTIGLELARFGLPVVAAFPDVNPYPVGSFIDFSDTRTGHFAAIEAALSQAASIDAITEAFRWTHFMFWSPEIDVSDVVPTAEYAGVPPWRMPANAHQIRQVLLDGAERSLLAMAELPRGGAAIDAEREAILAQVGRFARFFVSGVDETGSIKRMHATADGGVTVEHDGRLLHRYSPLANRLVRAMRPYTAPIGALTLE